MHADLDPDFAFELQAFSEIMTELDDRVKFPPDVVAAWVPDLAAAADDIAQLAVLLMDEDYEVLVGQMAQDCAELIGDRAGLDPDLDAGVAGMIRQAAMRLGSLLAAAPAGHA